MPSFEELYILYFDDVYRFLLNLTKNGDLAEELTAETFFKALRGIRRFRGDCDIRVWLCQIAKNSYYTHQKKQKRFIHPGGLASFPSPAPDLSEPLIEEEASQQIRKALSNLPSPYQEVFRLRVFGELSFKQIASLFGKTDHWACVTYHRAKEKIQNMME